MSRDSSFRVYSDATPYMGASSPVPSTIAVEPEIINTHTDELSEAEDLASDDSDTGTETTKKVDGRTNLFSRKVAEISKITSACGESLHEPPRGLSLSKASQDAQHMSSENFVPLPSTNATQKNGRARRNRSQLLIPDSRPPVRLPQPSANRNRQAGRGK